MTVGHDWTQATGTRHYFMLWDWCTYRENAHPLANNTSFMEFIPMDNTFATKYLRFLDGNEEQFVAQVSALDPASPNGGCWEAFIYNYSRGQWDFIGQTLCGYTRNPWATTGWTMWESWNYMDVSSTCYSFPSIGARAIMTLGSNGGWNGFVPNRQLNSNAHCWDYDGPYTFGPSPTSTNSWIAKTPNP